MFKVPLIPCQSVSSVRKEWQTSMCRASQRVSNPDHFPKPKSTRTIDKNYIECNGNPILCFHEWYGAKTGLNVLRQAFIDNNSAV